MHVSKRKDNFQESGKLSSGSSVRTGEIIVEIAFLWDFLSGIMKFVQHILKLIKNHSSEKRNFAGSNERKNTGIYLFWNAILASMKKMSHYKCWTTVKLWTPEMHEPQQSVSIFMLLRKAKTDDFVWITKNAHSKKSHLSTTSVFFTEWEEERCLQLVEDTPLYSASWLVKNPNQNPNQQPHLTKGRIRNALQL